MVTVIVQSASGRKNSVVLSRSKKQWRSWRSAKPEGTVADSVVAGFIFCSILLTSTLFLTFVDCPVFLCPTPLFNCSCEKHFSTWMKTWFSSNWWWIFKTYFPFRSFYSPSFISSISVYCSFLPDVYVLRNTSTNTKLEYCTTLHSPSLLHFSWQILFIFFILYAMLPSFNMHPQW